MDEQRILEEMERMLAADDPRLAARLAAFGRPGFTEVMRGRRARVTFSLMLLGVVAAAAVVIYILSAFRLASGGPATHLPRATPSARQSVPLPAPGRPSPRHRPARSAPPGWCTAWRRSPPPRAPGAPGRAGGSRGRPAGAGPVRGRAPSPGRARQR